MQSTYSFLLQEYSSGISKYSKLAPAKRLGHFEFKTLRSSTIVRLLLAPQVKKQRKKYFTLRLRRRPYYNLLPPIEREKTREISPFKNFACLSNYAIPQVSSKKRVQASDPEDPTLCRH
jgi:hypothetical protein